jgi:hypothetical protein
VHTLLSQWPSLQALVALQFASQSNKHFTSTSQPLILIKKVCTCGPVCILSIHSRDCTQNSDKNIEFTFVSSLEQLAFLQSNLCDIVIRTMQNDTHVKSIFLPGAHEAYLQRSVAARPRLNRMLAVRWKGIHDSWIVYSLWSEMAQLCLMHIFALIVSTVIYFKCLALGQFLIAQVCGW